MAEEKQRRRDQQQRAECCAGEGCEIDGLPDDRDTQERNGGGTPGYTYAADAVCAITAEG